MLVNLKELLAIAEENKNAVGCFNAPNLTSIRAIIKAAEELNQPISLTHAQLHEEKGLVTIKTVIFGSEQEISVSVNDIERY